MKRNLVKGMMTCLVLLLGLTVNATLGTIAVSGYISSSDGESLSKVSITCPTNSSIEERFSGGDGFYSVSGLRNGDQLSFQKSGFHSESRTISDSQGSSQQLDIEMSSN